MFILCYLSRFYGIMTSSLSENMTIFSIYVGTDTVVDTLANMCKYLCMGYDNEYRLSNNDVIRHYYDAIRQYYDIIYTPE